MSVESPQSDADLLEAVRGGNAAAYGELYERHVAAARSMARQLVRSQSEVEDVVAEAFTKILDLVGRGGGPESGFRTYLLTVVRRTVYDRTRVERRQVTTGEIEEYDPGVPFVDPALAGLEKSLIARAFLSLPERWRAVLWHTEVENAKPADVAPLLGLSANGVAALAYRAREGLRQAYLQMHLAASPQEDCWPTLGLMGAYVRGGLARRDTKAVDNHVNGCDECHSVLLELTDVNSGLRVIVGPLIAGPAFTGYIAAALKTGGASGLLHALGWIRRAPKQQQAAVVGGTAVAVAAAAVLMLVSSKEPMRKPAPTPPVALPPVTQEPPPVKPSAKPTKPAKVLVPPTAKPARARLRATIDPLGSLVRAQPGIVGMRLRNSGKGPSRDLEAEVALPPGVTLLAPGSRGNGVALVDPVGTVDGWSCRTTQVGALCARGPLGAGQGTAVFLRVQVSSRAPEGAGPAVRITSGGLRVQAQAAQGVQSAGAPARFATDGNVVVSSIGNSLLTCPSDRAGCAETLQRKGDRRDNDLWPLVPRDQDHDPRTAASSAARLELPKGGQVVWAGLYWSASVETGGPIKIKAPGRRRYLAIRPTEVLARDMPVGPGYQAFADVTALVGTARRKGTWWAADAPMRPGVSQHAGWSLVVIATDPAQPYSQAVVLDMATVVGGPHPTVELPLGGLIPAASPARVELVTWEGDADLKGDKVSLGAGPLTPAGGDADPDDVFDGSSNGAQEMTFGTDVDTFSAMLGPAPKLSIATRKDVVLFGVAAVSVRARS
ncbi:sigma-70 family RNA polymerase sigma factor [Nonomuraea sediminis]|uniref:sigma-70 family RNA polymerase sigma factor n=1 Tax=Nonomuraea sediminis TaxID=2835864 RepID=UPI001BDDBDF5|nr:sigma-70 family RNA polymerase sigma factor [Nonomuraea sediminis]